MDPDRPDASQSLVRPQNGVQPANAFPEVQQASGTQAAERAELPPGLQPPANIAQDRSRHLGDRQQSAIRLRRLPAPVARLPTVHSEQPAAAAVRQLHSEQHGRSMGSRQRSSSSPQEQSAWDAPDGREQAINRMASQPELPHERDASSLEPAQAPARPSIGRRPRGRTVAWLNGFGRHQGAPQGGPLEAAGAQREYDARIVNLLDVIGERPVLSCPTQYRTHH